MSCRAYRSLSEHSRPLYASDAVDPNLVVDLLVQVLDEDVALAGLAEGGVTLRPHDTAIQSFMH